jgi:hypothetical protein
VRGARAHGVNARARIALMQPERTAPRRDWSTRGSTAVSMTSPAIDEVGTPTMGRVGRSTGGFGEVPRYNNVRGTARVKVAA